jgi:predicted PurR-regulated permease PerM
MESPSLAPVQPVGGSDAVDTDTKRARMQRRLALHMPVDVRSVSLAIIATLLCFYTLRWAAEIVVPILMGVMVSYALGPVVNRLERFKVPRALGATALLLAILIAMGWGVWSLGDQTDALLETIPKVSQKIRDFSQTVTGKASTIERVQRAAADLATAADSSSSSPSASATTGGVSSSGAASTKRSAIVATPAPVATPAAPSRFDIRSYVVTGTVGLMSFLGKVAVVFFLALFLLSSGNSFRRKMVKLAGPKLSQKKVTIETLDEITEQIQRYLLVQVGVSVVVGVVTWLVFFALGVNQSAVWGVVAAVTNLIPYVGALLVGAGAAVVALVQFGTPSMALVVGGSSFAIHTVIGNVLTPWWMGRASKMSAVAVFVSVLLFGWLWGVAGLLLGVPILLVVKTVCDRVEDLKPIGELLGA